MPRGGTLLPLLLSRGAVGCAQCGHADVAAASPPAPPGYDPTVCWPLDNLTGLPAECGSPKWSLDPPCPRCYANTAKDYVPGQSTNVSAQLRARMADALPQYIKLMTTNRPASYAKDNGVGGGTVFSGHGGRALILLKLYAASGDAAHLTAALAYVDAVVAKLPAQKRADAMSGEVGFQWSHIGMLCVAAVAADMQGDAAGAAAYVAEVQKAFDSAAGKYDDFDAGRAGLIYAARFLAANIAPRGVAKIPDADVLRVATLIVDRGVATGKANGNAFLQWHGPNDNGLWLGQSHGAAGVIQQLVEVPGLAANATASALIRATLDHICDVQQPSGNFPTEYYNATQDWLVQWDHGAPGVAAALLAGWKVFGDARYRAAAEKALDCTWRRGLVIKGLMNCHGISGNTWMQLYAGRVTGDPKYLHRALAFQETVLGTPHLSDPAQMRQEQPLPDAPWQFWTASVESAIELWTDLLYRDPARASMTGWYPDL